MTAAVDADDVLVGRNWARWLPDTCIAFFLQWAAIVGQAPVTRGILAGLPLFDGMIIDDRGWASPAWDRLQPYAHLDLAHIAAQLNQLMSPSDADPEDPRQRRTRIDEAAARVGAGTLASVNDVFTYMLTCRLINAQPGASPTTYSLSPDPPLPSQVLRLPAEEATHEAVRYGWYRHGDAAERIVSLVGLGHMRLTSSLEKLSKRTLLGSESVREALLWLIGQGIVQANADIATLDRYKVFEVVPHPQQQGIDGSRAPSAAGGGDG
ncbi:DUF6042 family protein [Nonomuraea sp. SYSU D8015]|uniref:DUF6042 family protein n=1 Tax=Nonomuraea sp. SYSU D8015 TaxID=2593644 RepID=UPI0016612B80|nr:DUF6042 family protein [Nonomuraea sp. SYSU D8015]